MTDGPRGTGICADAFNCGAWGWRMKMGHRQTRHTKRLRSRGEYVALIVSSVVWLIAGTAYFVFLDYLAQEWHSPALASLIAAPILLVAVGGRIVVRRGLRALTGKGYLARPVVEIRPYPLRSGEDVTVHFRQRGLVPLHIVGVRASIRVERAAGIAGSQGSDGAAVLNEVMLVGETEVNTGDEVAAQGRVTVPMACPDRPAQSFRGQLELCTTAVGCPVLKSVYHVRVLP